jgi:hypothetical protein
MSGEKWNIGGL